MYAVPAIIAVNIILIAANAVMLLGGPNTAFDKLSRLPTAWGAFFGSLVGLIGVAWTAQRGFRNLIAAQEHRANIEAKAREHQYHLDESKYDREQRDRAKTAASAIIAELSGLWDRIQAQRDIYRTQIIILKAAKSEIKGYKTKISMPKWDVPIWNNYVSEIGLFGPSITGDLVSVYAKCATATASETPELDVDMAILGYNGLIETYEPWCKDILHVISRLSAFMANKEDPGPLFFTPHRREQREKAAEQASGSKDKSTSASITPLSLK